MKWYDLSQVSKPSRQDLGCKVSVSYKAEQILVPHHHCLGVLDDACVT